MQPKSIIFKNNKYADDAENMDIKINKKCLNNYLTNDYFYDIIQTVKDHKQQHGGNNMCYYRVKPEYDQRQRVKNHNHKMDGIFVANELYTARELDKFFLTKKQDSWFEAVEIPKNKVYWMFGCRFEMST